MASFRNIKHFVFFNFEHLFRRYNTSPAVFHKTKKVKIDTVAVIPMHCFIEKIFVKSKIFTEYCIIHLKLSPLFEEYYAMRIEYHIFYSLSI